MQHLKLSTDNVTRMYIGTHLISSGGSTKVLSKFGNSKWESQFNRPYCHPGFGETSGKIVSSGVSKAESDWPSLEMNLHSQSNTWGNPVSATCSSCAVETGKQSPSNMIIVRNSVSRAKGIKSTTHPHCVPLSCESKGGAIHGRGVMHDRGVCITGGSCSFLENVWQYCMHGGAPF